MALDNVSDDDLLNETFKRFTVPQLIDALTERQRRGSKVPVARRLGVFPITDTISFKAFEEQLAAFWVPGEANFEKDRLCFSQLSPEEKSFLKMILAIFAFQDGDVIENLVLRFLIEAPTVEGKLFYLAQALIEAIHAHSYSLQIHNITDSQEERDEMINAVDRLSFLKEKELLNEKYKSGQMSLAERQVAYGCLEGIGFSSLFAGIFAFKHRKPYLSLDGIFFSNEKIAQDEGLHRDYGVNQVRLALSKNDALHEKLDPLISEEILRVSGGITPQRVLEIVKEFVAIEEMCVNQILPTCIPTLTNAQLKDYVHFVADRYLVDVGLEKHYHIENPLPYMDALGDVALPNFFERRVGNYQRIGTKLDIVESSADDEDF